MALILKINGTDRSNYVKWDTLQKTEILTKEVDRMEFEILKTPSKTAIPDISDEVTLEENGNKIFGGVIVERNEVNKGGTLLGYQIRCKDYSQFLDRKVVTKNYENQTARAIVLDIIGTFTNGFTTTNVALSTPTIKSIKFNYEQVTRSLSQLSDQIGWDWYVDYDKDIHFFDEETSLAPFNLDDTSGNFEWNTLEINKNLLQAKNAVYVRGGEYKKTIAEGDAIDKYVGDGTRTTFQLAYKYDNITVKKGGVVQTVGTDQQTDPSSVDVLYNFNEKFIKFTVAPSNGTQVAVYGDAFIPIIALVRDQISITTYGEYQAALVDKSIASVSEAQTRAKAELKKYSQTVFEARFKTTKTGLRVGQKIAINSAIRNISKNFKINRIVGKARGNDHMEYETFLIASGQISFTDIMVNLLGQDKKNIVIATNEVLQRLESFFEAVAIADATVSSKDSPPYKWGLGSSNDFRWDFATWSA